MSRPFIIAQITDCHVGERGSPFDDQFESGAHLGAAVRHIMTMDPQPDVVIATGDLIHEGQREEYEHFSEMLSPLSIPVYLIPGNHDDRDNMRSVFADHDYLPAGQFLQYSVDEQPLRLVFLDTLIPGETGGELCGERLTWLAEKLDAEPNRPTFIAMHHPPQAIWAQVVVILFVKLVQEWQSTPDLWFLGGAAWPGLSSIATDTA